MVLVVATVLGLDVADQLPEIPRDGPQLREVRPSRGAQQSFATHQGADALNPAAPADLRDDDGDQRDNRSDADKEEEHVPSRFLAAARHEAHVVHDYQVPDGHSFRLERPDRHQQRAMVADQQMSRRA